MKDLQIEYKRSIDTILKKSIYENNPFIIELKNEFDNLYNSLISMLNSNSRGIGDKISSPSETLNLQNSSDSVNQFNAFIIKINTKISEHNKEIDNKHATLEDIKDKFWDIIRWDYDQIISPYLQDKNKITLSITKINNEIIAIDTEIKKQNEIIQAAQKNTINIEEAIDNINYGITELGINDFSIMKHSDNLYKIKRTENCKFETLSEGEKMIISFLYFCELCKGKKAATSQYSKKIVVIDDPISSLSHIWVFNIGQLIKENFFHSDTYEQVFVLTHNLYFFYELTNTMNVRKKDDNKKLKLFRIVKKQNGSQILEMDYDEIKNDYQSYWSIIKDDANQQPTLVANCMRNVIEHFFGFVQNVELNSIFQKAQFKNTKYQSFLRFMNRKSHSTGRNIFDTSELNLDNFKKAFKLVFTENGYEEHYNTMMEKTS